MAYGCPHCRDTDPEEAAMHDGTEDFSFAVVCSFCLGSHDCTCDDCLRPVAG